MRFLCLDLASLAVLVGFKAAQLAPAPTSACNQGPKVAAEIPRSPAAQQTLLAELGNFSDMLLQLYNPTFLPVAVVGKENEDNGDNEQDVDNLGRVDAEMQR